MISIISIALIFIASVCLASFVLDTKSEKLAVLTMFIYVACIALWAAS